jgi:hypothetical protein
MSDRYTVKDLEMPDDEPMVIIRSSLLWICDGDKYAAAALNMYIHWTRWIMKHKAVAQKINQIQRNQQKTPTQDTSLIIYRKQSELVEDLLHFCNEKRLRQANVFLVSKGLLKIENMPRHIADHILKYELQIDVFKKLMGDWYTYREGSQLSDEDEMVEVTSEADVAGTDNSPLRNGHLPDSPRSRNGQFTDRSGQFTAPKVIDDNKETLRDNKKEVVVPHDDNTSSFSKNVKVNNALSEKEQQLIKWYCEVSGMKSVNMAKEAAKECMVAILPEIKTKEDMSGLYEQAKIDIEARSDAPNKIIFFANLKDSLLNWKQKKVAAPKQVEAPRVEIWTKYSHYDGFKTSVDLWFLFEEMPLIKALSYDIAENGGLSNTKKASIKSKLAEVDEATRRQLAEAWAKEHRRQNVAV